MTSPFTLVSPFAPMGDQPTAIVQLVEGIRAGTKWQTLLGATGTGKTFTMANVIQQIGRPTLVISHNKTLAAQLFEELRELFPRNAVGYFVSYYDYFQPEAYIPQRDIYIEKDASRNADLDRLRLAATSSILSRDDVIVVASVSCIYGLGSPDEYKARAFMVERGRPLNRREFLLALSGMQYTRNDLDPSRGNFRVRGDGIEVWPAYEQHATRIDLFGTDVDRIEHFDPLTGEVLATCDRTFIFPAVHHMMPAERMKAALEGIQEELRLRTTELDGEGKLLEAQRLLGRTRYDLEMLRETGSCLGIENYSRHMDGRPPGSRPGCLLDYFRSRNPDRANDWLVFVDESHVTVPQIRGMQHGDRARKQTLVEHGFRLPSALDNRPLMFEEWTTLVPQAVFVSATPATWELEQSGGIVVEQVIRPTGLVDPPIDLKPARGQIADLLESIRPVTARKERTLVTALTKRLCEELTEYLKRSGVRVQYLHSDIETLERLEILKALREGDFDVLVGVNLLREGLDLPEVALVAILDADKQGFLRSRSSLIQTMGRAARNANSRCILYADTVTPEMADAIQEVERRRAKQLAYNAEHGIIPTTITKAIRKGIESEIAAGRGSEHAKAKAIEFDRDEVVRQLTEEMLAAADRLEFERAARLRDEIDRVKAGADPTDSGRSGPAARTRARGRGRRRS
ncbi:MAG: excinuclease ABC subunit UvrB [Planctomycetota bacterium]|nr:excinuclease ABC subunit UvrB [Planctomycetota bacterium]MDA1104975.1 excinuclease ABC subunit UvrB [Planctomycetota bacterium]